MPTHLSKNIVYGSITAGGNVHIGDITYIIEQDFQHSILFLRITQTEGEQYALNLHIKSRHHADQTTLVTKGEPLLHEAVQVCIAPDLFQNLADFQAFRRRNDNAMRLRHAQHLSPAGIAAFEHQLAWQIHQTFFAGDIGQVCADFIALLEDKRIEDLLLVIAADEERVINLPFEMVLPLLFPPKLGEAKKSLTPNNFGLVRTHIKRWETFQLQGKPASAAPLKMLFITALPENLDERGKMLQMEEEQTRLIRAIGALEATGDRQPKIVIEFLDNASLNELDKALHDRQHDIVHISGHGAYLPQDNKGVLYFEDEAGDLQEVTGKALGETLRQHSCVKLLILSACETAMTGSEGGVTEQAAAYGVPCIVAMRFAVTDEGAKIFTTELYAQLANAAPIAQAVAYAREALHRAVAQQREQASQIPHIAEWFTPVVYQNQAMEALIDNKQLYLLPDNFYPKSTFLKTQQSRLIGEGFIGRKRYLIQLRQAFRKGQHVCLHGLGGLGKTTLAEAFAHNYGNRSHSVLIFRNAHQINEAYILQSLHDELAELNPKLGKQVKQLLDDPQTEVLHKLQLLIDNYLKNRKTILIFDNAEDIQTNADGQLQQNIVRESLSEFLRHLCENAPNDCHILLTSRYKIADLSEVILHLPLDKMGYAEQYRLLNYSETLRLHIALHDREAVYNRLDGHPRAYEFLETLLKNDKTFNWQQVADTEAKVFENLLLQKVYDRLTEREKSLLQVVSVFISRTPLAALAAVSGQSETELLPQLQALQDWSLCIVDKDGSFDTHRLTREWLLQRHTPAELLKECAAKAGEYFENQPTWDDEILAIAYYEMAERWEAFASTSFRLQGFYQRQVLYPQALQLNQAVLDRNIDDTTNAKALNYSGLALDSIGQYDNALICYQKSLSISQQIGDKSGEGTTLNNISQIYKARGDYDTALTYLEQSLSIRQQIGDKAGEGATLNNLATTAHAKGDYDTALTYLEQSLSISQQIGDKAGEGATLNNISQIYDARGDYDTALTYLQQALSISQQIGDKSGEGTTLNNLAGIARAKGDYDTALSYLQQSLAIQQQIGNKAGEGTTLNNISHIYKVRGDYDTALTYLQQSLSIRQQIGDIAGMANTLYNMGAMLYEQGHLEEAIPLLLQAYSILYQIGSPNVQYPAGYLGTIIEQIGEARFQEIIAQLAQKT